MPRIPVKIGDTFLFKGSAIWRDQWGDQQVTTWLLRCHVSALLVERFDYVVDEVVSVSNAPPFEPGKKAGMDVRGMGGGIGYFIIPRYERSRRLQWLS